MINLTVGVGGDYATFGAVITYLQGLGDLTDNYTFTAISDTTEISSGFDAINYVGFSVVFDGAWYTQTMGNGETWSISNDGYTGYHTVRYMGFVQTAGNSPVLRMYKSGILGPNISAEYWVDKCTFRGAGNTIYDGRAFDQRTAWDNFRITNCLISNFGYGIDLTPSNGDSRAHTEPKFIENVTIYNCAVGVDTNAAFEMEYSISNVVVTDCVIQDWILGSGDVTYAVLSNCGDSDGSLGAGTDHQQNLVSADEFISIAYGNADFMRIDGGTLAVPSASLLATNGIVPVYAGSTDLAGNGRPGNGTDYAIGAYEVECDGGYVGKVQIGRNLYSDGYNYKHTASGPSSVLVLGDTNALIYKEAVSGTAGDTATLVTRLSMDRSSGLFIEPILNATTDTDKFLCSDGGTIKYRTGAELASDLGLAADYLYKPGIAGGQVANGGTANGDSLTLVATASGDGPIYLSTGASGVAVAILTDQRVMIGKTITPLPGTDSATVGVYRNDASDDALALYSNYTGALGAETHYYKSRGTVTTQTNVAVGDVVGGGMFHALYSSWVDAGHARLEIRNISDGDISTQFVWATSAAGTMTDTMKLDEVGTVSLLQTESELRFYEGVNYTGFMGNPALTANQLWTLPSADGTAGQSLVTDASGNLSWADGYTGLTIGDAITGGTATRILYEDGSNQLAQSANFAWDSATNSLLASATAGAVNAASYYQIGGVNVINIDGTANILLGNAGANNTGINSVLIGSNAGTNNTGDNQVFIGESVGPNATGIENTGCGYNSLKALLGGYGNAAYGGSTLLRLTNGNDNTAFGAGTGQFLTTEIRNTLFGREAGKVLTGSYNTLSGYQSGVALKVATANTGYGYVAGHKSVTATDCVWIGAAAAYGICGNETTVVGRSAGFTGLGSGDVILGHKSGYYETGSNTYMLANGTSGTEAGDRAAALMYGLFAGHASGPYLQINAETKIGDVAGGNYFENETTGFVKFTGSAKYYNDIQFPTASGKVPASNAPTWETFTTNTNEFAFDVGDYIDLQANEYAHWCEEGQTADFHLHCTTKTAQATGSDRFAKFEVWVAYGDTDTVWTEATGTAELTIPTGTAALEGFYLDLLDVDFTGYVIGTQIKVRIKRIAATGGTEYADDMYITQVGAHFMGDTIGSRTEGAK